MIAQISDVYPIQQSLVIFKRKILWKWRDVFECVICTFISMGLINSTWENFGVPVNSTFLFENHTSLYNWFTFSPFKIPICGECSKFASPEKFKKKKKNISSKRYLYRSRSYVRSIINPYGLGFGERRSHAML